MAQQQSEGPSVRLLRVGEQVRHVLSDILQRGDVHDDVLSQHVVSVTEVRMSPDLRHATVFIKSLLGKRTASASNMRRSSNSCRTRASTRAAISTSCSAIPRSPATWNRMRAKIEGLAPGALFRGRTRPWLRWNFERVNARSPRRAFYL
jgi:ribosome-binding factor A